jgi:hypothetical protein
VDGIEARRRQADEEHTGEIGREVRRTEPPAERIGMQQVPLDGRGSTSA